MTVSRAQLKANKKYDNKFDKVLIRVPLGEKELITAHAEERGESVNSFVRRAISETIERDKAQ